MTKISRFLRSVSLLLVAYAVAPYAYAGSGCASIFSAAYPDSLTDDQAGCQTCHQGEFGGSTFNVYGQSLLDAGASGAGFSCNNPNIDFAAVLGLVETVDSDLEGNNNLAEILADTQPGWCDSANAGCVNSAGTPPAVPLDPAGPPSNNAPVADAGGPYSGEAGSTLIQFDGSASSDADGDTLTFAWDFGDGISGSGAMPTHTYTAAGSYPVTLVVNDGTVDSSPATTSAQISAPPVNLPPVADPGGPYTGEPGQPITFDGSGSADPNADALTYAWDFGDGAMGSGVMPTHSYVADGVYTVSLTVSDGPNTSVIATTTATIATPPANSPPMADAGGPYSGESGTPVTFDGSASSDPDGDSLTYQWDFGDGQTGTGVAPTHSYSAAGSYTVSLIVNDGSLDSPAAGSTATIAEAGEPNEGQAIYDTNCLGCHADPWDGPAVDGSLPGLRRVAGARTCSIEGSIFGTSVFPNGVPEMQFLQGMAAADIEALAEYLNSSETSGERRYVTACAGCHGNTGSGGRVDEDVHGDSAGETLEAIAEESEMQYLACMPVSDINVISEYLAGMDDDNDDDGIDDDEDNDDDGDGINDEDDSDDDNDGLDDEDEYDQGTDPRDHDSDDDGVDDGQEIEDGSDPLDSDSDDDGLDDGEEASSGTDPNDADTDNDGVSDFDEVKVLGTNPLDPASNAVATRDSGGGSPSLPFLVLLTLLGFASRAIKAGQEIRE